MKLQLPLARLAVELTLATGAAVMIVRLQMAVFGPWRLLPGPAVLALVSLYVLYRSYREHRAHMEREQRDLQQACDVHLATIAALAHAIDAKDRGIDSRVGRMELFATRLAESLGLPASEVQGVKTAALLHNIGKLAIPEHILTKSGPLTEAEFRTVQIHPQIGAEIIAGVPFPYAVAPLILSHRERWDGKGYPQGLAAEHIPIGARILTAVDYYDSITTDRPYRKAVNHETAVSRLVHESGRALDPEVVRTLVRLLPDLVKELETTSERPVTCESITDGRPSGSVATARDSSQPTMVDAFENIALAHREVHALYDIAQSMGTSLGIADTMAVISAKLLKIVPWSGCALFLQESTIGPLRCRFATGVEGRRLLYTCLNDDDGLASWAAGDRRTLVNADPRVTFSESIPADSTLSSAIVCPLFSADTFIGCLALYHTEPNHYSDDHRRLVERVAEQAGAVIHNAILFEQAQEDSMTDPLTSLPNRRSLFVHLARELARAERLRNEVSLVMLDLDDFKSINDSRGHDIGDQALRQAAASLRSALRPYDLCVRYGGDEFIVVLGECSRPMADAKLCELKARIAEIEIDVRDGKRIKLGASAGAAVFPQDGASAESLIGEADRQMYRDKAARRGQDNITKLPPAPDRGPTEPARH